jgi:PAS domain S-box-containing protein
MNAASGLRSFVAQQWTLRSAPWIGGAFIAIIVAFAAHDIWRSYHAAIAETGKVLESQAKIIAEQTARSVQALDVVLRHLADQHRAGAFKGLTPDQIHATLKKQATPLVQADGLAWIDVEGTVVATAYAYPVPPGTTVIDRPGFQTIRGDPSIDLYVGDVVRSRIDGRDYIPVTRALRAADGTFVGMVGARGRIDYFQDFYKDAQPDAATRVALLHRNGTLLARHPPAPEALGKQFPQAGEMLDAYFATGASEPQKPRRGASPVDGVERFAAIRPVADYPMMVVVSRDADVALAAWRSQAFGTAMRTLAAAALAAVLLALLMRQFSDLVAARASLEESKERFTLAVAGSDDGIWDWDCEAGVVFASQRAREIMGLAPGPETQRAEDWFGSLDIHPDDAAGRMAAMQAHMHGTEPAYAAEFRVRHPDGRYRWVHVRGLCVQSAPGRPLRMAGSITDIDARKNAERALRESEEQKALAVAGSNDGILYWDIVRDSMYSSERAMKILGMETDVTVRRQAEFASLLKWHPDDQARQRKDLEDHLAGRTAIRDGEYRVRHPDGSWRWVRVRAVCVRDEHGHPLRWGGSVSDIDAQKRAEESLRQSEARYAVAMAGSNEAHWVWDVANDELFASPMLRQMFRIPAELELKTRNDFLDAMRINPDDRIRLAQNMDAHLAGRTPRLDIEYRVTDRDTGETRWIQTRAQAFRDAGGKVDRVGGATVEITERKRAEEALRISEERFALAVAGSNDGIVDWDIVNDRMYSSERAMQIVGIDSTVTVRSRSEWRALIRYHPDDLERMQEDLRRCLDGETDLRDGEYRVLMPNGEYRWIRHRNKVVRDAQRRAIRLAGSLSDIDEYKKTEAALRESQERFALAVSGSDDGIWDWDLESGRAFGSLRAREIAALPPAPEVQPLDEWMRAFESRLHPEDLPRRNESIRAHLAGEAPTYEGEYRVLGNDGAYRWIRIRGVCLRRPDGRPYRMSGSVSDVNARKVAEEALRESEQRFALAVAAANDGVLDWDMETDRMFTSERAMRIFGIDSDVQVRTQAEWSALVLPRFHPEDAQRLSDEKRLRMELSGNPEHHKDAHEGEYRIRHANGNYRWVRLRGKTVNGPAGTPIRWAGSVSDIDAEKRAEQALRDSEQRYELAVAGSNEGLWDWDLKSDILYLSPRAQELIGLVPGEPSRPRRVWNTFQVAHPDDQEHVRKAISDYLHGRCEHFEIEYRAQHASGQWRWYRDRGVAVRGPDGKALRMAGSMEDITDRKTAEAERDRLEGQLRQSQKLEAMGTLAGGIAHDFNNILAAILGYGEMAQKDAGEGTALRRHIDAAMSAGMRAKSLVERILAFSRSGMGERAPVHVQSVVDEACDQLAASLPSDIRLERDLSAGDAAVVGDPTQIHQVVMNLCANGVQAMKAGGTLTVSVAAVRRNESITVAANVLRGGDYIRLRVTDTGTGIPNDIIDRIFDPFFTTKGVGAGTGLGLSLVHGIVTDLGGGVEVQSTPGQGTTFTVYLPWQGTVEPPSPVDEAAVPNGTGEAILLVDDEESLVRVGEEMLAQLGYEPVGFNSSVAALESFRAEPQRFSAILSDEAMPMMTGSELAREVRKIHKDIPIVLMSGYVTPALTARAQDAGVVEVLAKPLVSRDIARSLASALRR